MNIFLIVLGILLTVGGLWIAGMFAEKKKVLKDDNDNYVPDVVENKVKEVKDAIETKIENTKRKIKDKL